MDFWHAAVAVPFRWLLQHSSPHKVALPAWSCDTLLQAFEGLNISTRYYQLDQSFLPKDLILDKDELLLWINPFGLYNRTMSVVAKRYGSSVIFDLTQAFFATPPEGALAFTSFRKFFPVSDGGQALGISYKPNNFERDSSLERMAAYRKAAKQGLKAASSLYLAAEESLVCHWRSLSVLTEGLMARQDFEGE